MYIINIKQQFMEVVKMLVYKIKNIKNGDYLKQAKYQKYDFATSNLDEAIREHRKMKYEGKNNYNDWKVVEV